MRLIYVFLFLCFLSLQGWSQQVDTFIQGTVEDASNDLILENVHVVNLTQVKGVITDTKGKFEIIAKANDTLYFSYIGYKPLKVRVTNDWIKYSNVRVKLTQLGIALEEVQVQQIPLTGYVEIDIKNIPVNNNYRYKIAGLPNTGYEAGGGGLSAINNALGTVLSPANLIYKTFGKKPREMRKLRKMKEDDEIRSLLETKFDRETLAALIQVERVDIDEILRQCNYSDDFIQTANDLQILDAISGCYEEYRVLSKNK